MCTSISSTTLHPHTKTLTLLFSDREIAHNTKLQLKQPTNAKYLYLLKYGYYSTVDFLSRIKQYVIPPAPCPASMTRGGLALVSAEDWLIRFPSQDP